VSWRGARRNFRSPIDESEQLRLRRHALQGMPAAVPDAQSRADGDSFTPVPPVGMRAAILSQVSNDPPELCGGEGAQSLRLHVPE
jgi:hypothetical protein